MFKKTALFLSDGFPYGLNPFTTSARGHIVSCRFLEIAPGHSRCAKKLNNFAKFFSQDLSLFQINPTIQRHPRHQNFHCDVILPYSFALCHCDYCHHHHLIMSSLSTCLFPDGCHQQLNVQSTRLSFSVSDIRPIVNEVFTRSQYFL